ncbi:RHS repeat-associated core domain-containing protein [Elizabethkingia sp. JS20170427COW]|nr:RHS repeat-associated core domain-containing protein [Elizabethkingia sp. JS20170427COW]
MQSIRVQSSPLGKDIVTPVEYDNFGRQTKQWLGLPQSSTSNGAFYSAPSSSIASSLYADPLLYAEKELENSPLDRVLQQASPGNSWSLSSGKTIRYGYEANKANEVKKLVTTTVWNSSSAMQSILKISAENNAYAASGYYAANTLYKNTVTDEDGNTTTEFKNGAGQTLLVRKKEGNTTLDTYYVYNEYQLLAFVLSPKASAVIQTLGGGAEVSGSILDGLCYQYRYDGKKRLVEKKLPGKGWEYNVYDTQDRLVLTQDAYLRTASQQFHSAGWLFNKYDLYGRVVYTGFFASTASRASMQTTFNNMSLPNVEKRLSSPSVSLQGLALYYSKNNFPNENLTLLSVNYYDTYPVDTPTIPGEVIGQGVLPQNPQTLGISTQSLPTASYLKNIENDEWTKSYTLYDTKGRAVATYSYNALGGYTKTESLLDFSGTPQQTLTHHKKSSQDSEVSIVENFTYDGQNRLTHHYHQVNSGSNELLSQNTYDELGRLSNKKVGHLLQSIDYSYNVRGWLTKVNNPAALGNHLFAYELRYEAPKETLLKRYNGNISEMDWATHSDGVLRRYGYSYDHLNRLTKASFQEPNTTIPRNNFYNEQLSYDVNGNITSLQRFQKPVSGTTAMMIDHLQYTYTANSNLLTQITDSSGNYLGYPIGGGAISYDANGNMTQMADKNISNITYNFLHLPQQITYAGNNISYTYRADGLKLKKVVGTNRVDYLDGFQYANNILQFIPTSEGYYDFVNNRYVYHYTDHLGNVRVSYYRNGSSPTILEESNYYPFGLKHEGYNNYAGNPNYQYKYNGKELQETGMYDYGWRQYMPDIGRWISVDPLAELSTRWSPYAYAYNNPIRFIDPDGRFAFPPNNDGGYKNGQIWTDSDGSWERTNGGWESKTEGQSSVIDEVVLTGKKNGGSVSFADAYSKDNKSGFHLLSAGYNHYGQYGAFESNLKLLSGEVTNHTFTGALPMALDVDAKASVLSAKVGGRLGTQNFNVYGEASGSELSARANLTIGVLIGENQKYGVANSAGIGASVLEGKVNGGVTIFGVRIGAEAKGCLECAKAEYKYEFYYDNKAGRLRINIGAGLGLGAGAGLGGNLDIPIR